MLSSLTDVALDNIDNVTTLILFCQLLKRIFMNEIKELLPQNAEFTKRLCDIDDPPKRLWYVGTLPERKPTVAVVGSRKPTSYGRAVSAKIVGELAAAGVIIVSGMAIGHDGLAHRACLANHGTTVAVIGNGLDNPHPHSNQKLFHQIIDSGGAVISEYPAGTNVHGWQFLARNRLISGLVDVVVVVEASVHSGTLNTAAHALSQGRTVMAVPGNITSPLSVGCNKLIAQGAQPVLSAKDVLEALGFDEAAHTRKSVDHKIRFNSPDAQKIYDLILAGESDGDALQKKSGLDSSAASIALTMLELNGYIKSLGGDKFMAN